MKKTILIFLFFLPLTIFASDLKGNITVKIDNIYNNKGEIRVALYKSEDGFPGGHEQAYKKMKSKIETGKHEVIFTDIPYGEYAIVAHHDENANEEMDTNFLGIPKEGQGSSNNPKSFFGPPKFKDAKFMLNSEKLIIDIKINY